MKRAYRVNARVCSHLKDRAGTATVRLALALMAALPGSAWGQWSGNNPISTTSNVVIGPTTPVSALTVDPALTLVGGNVMGGSAGNGVSLNSAGNNYGLDYLKVTANTSNSGLALNMFPNSSSAALPYDFQFNTSTGSQSALLLIGSRGTNQHEIVVSNDATAGSPWDLAFVVSPNNTNWAGVPAAMTIKAGTPANTLFLNSSGNVGIGTTSPQHLLHVAGTIGAEQVIVSSTGADYVFGPGYRLAPLSEVGDYIKQNGHLPDIPPAKDVQQKGVDLGEMQTKLLAKIEELTLHQIELERQNRSLRERMKRLEHRTETGANDHSNARARLAGSRRRPQ